MQGLKKKRRVQIILLTIVALVVATIMIGIAMKDGINYFRSPSEVVDAPPGPNETFRIGGLVEDGSLERGAGESVRFAVTDGAASVPVVFRGILPDLFGEGQGMVGTGSYIGGTFEATEILAKHDESYMPKEVVDALKEQGVYVEPES
tara:strand:+ start:590 stop:1033 length:444 start_codon:yes stop_codon:yes gene_type:complete